MNNDIDKNNKHFPGKLCKDGIIQKIIINIRRHASDIEVHIIDNISRYNGNNGELFEDILVFKH